MNRKGLYGYDISLCSGISDRLRESKLKYLGTLHEFLLGSRPNQHQPHSPCGRGRGDDGARRPIRIQVAQVRAEGGGEEVWLRSCALEILRPCSVVLRYA